MVFSCNHMWDNHTLLQAADASPPAGQRMEGNKPMGEPQERLLAEEIEFYEKNKDRFIREHTNRHLLIKGSELIGTFPTADQAIGEGVRRFGTGPFLVRLAGEDTPTITAPALVLGLLCQS